MILDVIITTFFFLEQQFILSVFTLESEQMHMYIETTSRDLMVHFAFGFRFPTGGSFFLCRNSHPEWTESRNVELLPVCPKFGSFFPNFWIRDFFSEFAGRFCLKKSQSRFGREVNGTELVFTRCPCHSSTTVCVTDG